MGVTWSSTSAPAPAAAAPASIDPEKEDKKLQADIDYRSAAQKRVLQYVNNWSKNVNNYNKLLVPDSAMLSISLRETDSSSNSKKISKCQKVINDEDAWWKANPSLTKRQTNTRITQFTENIDPQLKEINELFASALSKLTPEEQKAILDDVPEQADAVAAATLEQEKKDAKAQAEIDAEEESRTFTDNFNIGAKKALYYVGIFVYILTALRLASFVANDLLYRPLAYRIIGFIYGFIGAPVVLFYYLYREFTNTPPYYSFFPLYPYNQIDNAFGQLLYGYPTDIERFLESKRQVRSSAEHNALSSTQKVLDELMAQREKRFEESKAN